MCDIRGNHIGCNFLHLKLESSIGFLSHNKINAIKVSAYFSIKRYFLLHYFFQQQQLRESIEINMKFKFLHDSKQRKL